jgi:hypothetical protein
MFGTHTNVDLCTLKKYICSHSIHLSPSLSSYLSLSLFLTLSVASALCGINNATD